MTALARSDNICMEHFGEMELANGTFQLGRSTLWSLERPFICSFATA
jgi:hypothetical protein